MNIAEQAWDMLKAPTDPAFAQCALEFRNERTFQAERAVATGKATTPFEKMVLRLNEEEATKHPSALSVVTDDTLLEKATDEVEKNAKLNEEIKDAEDDAKEAIGKIQNELAAKKEKVAEKFEADAAKAETKSDAKAKK